ncbi:rhamnogalacturonan acetylesterase [Paenibacillus campi]|uniref:rhamnogalacturonan acetylesterase n=1 Tax=Paenibacillus campi TaxID=3106031 RepID=UPI002B001DA5|nr:rhamnogalacturonan acetylesterase [Paenibacillus sp. SGZ-1014]
MSLLHIPPHLKIAMDGNRYAPTAVSSSASNTDTLPKRLAEHVHTVHTDAHLTESTDIEAIRPAIYIAGDSTAAIKGATEKPMSGWGEYLGSYMRPSIAIHNHAVNGRSTRSFIAEGRLHYIADQLHAGDYVFIQFGHNDSKVEDIARYADPEHDYRRFLRQYIDTTRARAANPVLLTSVSRRLFLANGQLDPAALGSYPAAMRQVATDTDTPLIDLFQHSQQLYRELGEADSAALFMHLHAGAHPNYPEGISDNTHFSAAGAQRIAALVAHAIREHPQLTKLAALLLA